MVAHTLVYCGTVVDVYGRQVDWTLAGLVIPALNRARAGLLEVERWYQNERDPANERDVILTAKKMLYNDMQVLDDFCNQATAEFDRRKYKDIYLSREEKEILLGKGLGITTS